MIRDLLTNEHLARLDTLDIAIKKRLSAIPQAQESHQPRVPLWNFRISGNIPRATT